MALRSAPPNGIMRALRRLFLLCQMVVSHKPRTVEMHQESYVSAYSTTSYAIHLLATQRPQGENLSEMLAYC